MRAASIGRNGLMVLQVEADMISGIMGFPDPWLFQQCGLPAELN
jgi:hypothetical protein